MTVFHVTEQKNVENIIENWLVPAIGKYASEMGKDTPAVWLFPTLEDAEEMAQIWLGPFYGDDLVYLRIELPDDFSVEYTESDYEIVSERKIPAEWISVL